MPDGKSITNLTDSKRKITILGLKDSSAKLLQVGTVLLSSRATIGRVAIANTELCTNQGFINITINNDKVLTKYFAYYLISIQDTLRNLGSQTTFPEISKSTFKSLQIPIPPIEIQQQIVDEMDAKNEYIKLTERIIKEQKQKMSHIIASIWNV